MDDDVDARPARDRWDAERTDVLGDRWRARTLHLRPDAVTRRTGVDPVATLVRRVPDGAPTRRAVLHLHGFVDYFFHPHVGDALAAAGYDTYALELRDHGRSIRPGRPPNETTDLAVYTEEIDAAVRALRADHDVVVLLGHSTGGLTAALWAEARRGLGLVDALVLNSPWLDVRGTLFERTALARAVHLVAGPVPRLPVRRIAPYYGRALHRDTGGEWDFDLAWKPHEGFPVRAGFVRAVRRGHARVARGLAVDVPVLVLASDAAGPHKVGHDALLRTDSVLDPAQIARRAHRLGDDVTFVEVTGGAHDLALSTPPVRERYLREVTDFLASRLPTG
ncbi:alpha/beta hydrolase [Cellulomonas wangsupingiae]|uniref:Alpha/beta hydrolase n=1 Tax=Cellulomonas wangsupingiae TaxID=2968085 RepID=A0ABY5K8F7_9CELL|nr:alpha/beta hydrolase [Cellulomonas wangsupingiae]MCC2336341.1 alpha/beta hydrolase [Cellulomonas wangsupingiae]UUI65681.1 alpha/beta hydrolase [Cellulomonas wangsupingiae]